jgi:broad specificity phosphatase PhoE
MSTGMPGGRRRVVVLRHGETVDNASGVWQGQRDTELSALGLAQAQAAGAALARVLTPSIVVSSDLRRAWRTAEVVAEACGGLPVLRDERLREIDVGQWSGRSGSEVARDFAPELAAIRAGKDIPRGVTGETVADLLVRVGAAVDEAVEELPPGGCAVIVCHGVAGRAAVTSLLGLEPRLAWAVLGGLSNGHWAALRESVGGWRQPPWMLEAWNAGPAPIEDPAADDADRPA